MAERGRGQRNLSTASRGGAGQRGETNLSIQGAAIHCGTCSNDGDDGDDEDSDDPDNNNNMMMIAASPGEYFKRTSPVLST